METLAKFLQMEIWFLLIGLLAVVGYQMLTGRINTAYLLYDKETREFSPVRLQLLFFTLMSAGFYFSKVAADPHKFPDVPQEVLLLLGGSNLVHLGGKGWTLISQFLRTKE